MNADAVAPAGAAETTAAAPKQIAQPAQDALAPAASAASEERGQVAASMSISRANAFFRPALRVAAIRPVPTPAVQPAPTKATPVAAPAPPAAPIAAQTPPATPQPTTPEFAAAPIDIQPPEIEVFEDEAPLDEASVAAMPIADSAADAAGVAAMPFGSDAVGEATPLQPAVRPRRKKNFFSRTLIAYPKFSGYFWPRSWRHAWKRRDAELARRKTPQTPDASSVADDI